MEESELELESRRRIYRHVAESPGTHFRSLVEELDYAKGTVQYHLEWLVKNGIVERSEDGKYTRYYPAESFDEGDTEVMNALRSEYTRRIVGHLASEGPLTTSELTDRLDKSGSTVSWHLSNLQENGVVEKTREGREVKYELTEPERVKYLYTVHRKSFADRVVDRLLDLWESY